MSRELEPSRRDEAPDVFGSRIYGLLVVGAALAIARPGAQSRWSVLLDVFAAALVYSLAHMYADILDERMHHARHLTRPERRAIAVSGLALLRATGAPFVILVVCWVLRVRTSISVNVALWILVAELGVTSWRAGVSIRPASRRVAYAAVATLLGGLLIVLKIVTH